MHCFNSNFDFDCSEFTHGSEGYLVKKNGARVFDTWLGAGTLLLGHTNEKKTISMTPMSKSLSDDAKNLIKKLVDYEVGGVGLQTSGSSAVTRACRVARTYNNRKKIALIGNYWHGSDDNFLYTQDGTALSEGLSANYGEHYEAFASTEEFLNDDNIERFSALLIEPHQGSEPSTNQLSILEEKEMRERMREKEILLICDEIITGFRECYGACKSSRKVDPDMTIFGKAISGGYPFGIVIANKEVTDVVKERKLFWGGTFSANNSQFTSLQEQLNKLRKLDYNMVRNNFEDLVRFLRNSAIFQEQELRISTGCNFGRILGSPEIKTSKITARGFIQGNLIDSSVDKLMKYLPIYIARNKLIFPSIHNIHSFVQGVIN